MFTRIICIALTISGIVLLMFSCEKEEGADLSQVKIGEYSNGVPTLSYANMPKLKRALQLAFLPTMRIDYIFMHEETDAMGNTQVWLTALGQETDSIYSSVNIPTRQINGISLVSEPVNPDVPRWCWAPFGCAECYVVNTVCMCASGGPGNNDKPCWVGSDGIPRPDDLLDIVVPYLSRQ